MLFALRCLVNLNDYKKLEITHIEESGETKKMQILLPKKIKSCYNASSLLQSFREGLITWHEANRCLNI